MKVRHRQHVRGAGGDPVLNLRVMAGRAQPVPARVRNQVPVAAVVALLYMHAHFFGAADADVTQGPQMTAGHGVTVALAVVGAVTRKYVA